MDMRNKRVPVNYDFPFMKTEDCSNEGSTCARTVASQTRLWRRGFGDAFHVVHVKEKCLMSFERYSLVQVI